MRELFIESFDKHKLCLNIYDNVKNPVGVVQIIHGMQEHQGRYKEFAEFLNKNKYIVYLSDLRGHGKTRINSEPWGYSKNDISEEILKDQAIISNLIKNNHPNLKITILGHSYGSFITQTYLMNSKNIDKFILSGSTYTKESIYNLARSLTNTAIKLFGRDADAKFVEKLSLKSYEKGFKNGNWLTRDESVWKEYLKDKFCGNSFRLNFYESLFKMFKNNYLNINNVNNNLPILIISGSNDPVGDQGKGVKKLYNFYRKNHLNVTLKLYDKARHEILNEPIKQTVYEDVLNFFDEHNPNKILDNFIENN